jgi:hypothetical protein
MSGVSKRTAILVAAVTAAVALAAGGVIGFILHAPGRPSTWTDARDWLTSAVLILGFPAAVYQLYLQRRQFADEAKRNAARDDLLDRQRRELQQAEQLRQRAQAEGIRFRWIYGRIGSTAQVENGSRRPIANITCQLDLDQGGTMLSPRGVSDIVEFTGGGSATVPAECVSDGCSVAVMRHGDRASFEFEASRRDHPNGRMLVRFTDDAGLHWELDHHGHLEHEDRGDASAVASQ